jgi:hypothetical protein
MHTTSRARRIGTAIAAVVAAVVLAAGAAAATHSAAHSPAIIHAAAGPQNNPWP